VILRSLILGLSLAFAAVLPAAAGDIGPVIPKATGSPHPEGNDYMRRHHMEMMKHDRDDVVHEGDRTPHASIGECFDCHTVRDEAGTPVTVADERHFCRACHDFAAVKIDCFDCHRSTPSDFDEPSAHALLIRPFDARPSKAGDAVVLQAYLDEVTTTEATQ